MKRDKFLDWYIKENQKWPATGYEAKKLREAIPGIIKESDIRLMKKIAKKYGYKVKQI